ncbi:hypothetical protein [Sulfitobacter sp. R18_1]|uniref:hypothetical protein n=1 Tax=Sulfitobacter sp. R18_1 TaxID=2821104 RepID=UPI001ADAE870|nr:hypothetical protein [Sulfitobacter sp. R18_1]MBO9428792.1 hypothetical protein [Sulfitobacter sp. R18_1]
MPDIKPLIWKDGPKPGMWVAPTGFGDFRITQSIRRSEFYCVIPDDMVGHVVTDSRDGGHFTRDSLEGAQAAAQELVACVVQDIDASLSSLLVSWSRDPRVPSRMYVVSPVGVWTIKPDSHQGFVCTPPASMTRMSEPRISNQKAETVSRLQEWVLTKLSALSDEMKALEPRLSKSTI